MSQITTGIRAVCSISAIYELLQKILGASQGRKMLINDFIKPREGMTVLDFGCGPADILAYFPDVEYYGFDVSESYIESAKNNFGERGCFFAKHLDVEDLESLPQFDVALMFGVLHHLDDATASNTLEMINDSLKYDGKLITIDPVFEKGQNPIARFLIGQDRGQNVRSGDSYYALAKGCFKSVNSTIQHRAFIPYTHCILECYKNAPI